MVDRSTAATLAVIFVVVSAFVPVAGCVGTGPGSPTTTRPDGPPSPPEQLTVASARAVALQNEAVLLRDHGSVGLSGTSDGPTAVARDIGDAVYVSVAYPYTRADGEQRVSRASYLVTTDAIRRFDPDAHATPVDTFAGTPGLADPVDVTLLAADPGHVSLSMTYTDSPQTVLAKRLSVGDGGRTLRDVAGRVGTYRVTAGANGSVVSRRFTVHRDASGAIVVVVDGNETVHLLRVGAPG